MVLHMELQHALQRVCVVTPAMCVCGLRTESSERGEQLRPRHSAGGHFTQSNWISRTVDPITLAVKRH